MTPSPRRRALAACLLLALACSSAEERRARHLARAEEYAAGGRRAEAVLELRAALHIEPRDAASHLRIARLLEEDGQADEAAFFYREAGRLDPALPGAALGEARLVRREDPARALALVDRALEQAPGDAATLVLRSELALSAGDADAAREAALAACEHAPEDGAAWRQLGVTELARVHQLGARQASPPAELLADAERALQRADSLLGGDPVARLDLGRLYAVWPGQRARAQAAFRTAVAASPPGATRARAAAVALEYARLLREGELARWALEEIVANAPDHLAAWDALADLEEERAAGAGDALYTRLLAARPDDGGAHVRSARFLARRGHADEALARLEAQAQAGPDPALALDALVSLHLSLGALESARAALARLEREHPGHPYGALATGRLRLAERRPDAAAEALHRALASEPSAEAARVLALAEFARGDPAAAVAAVDRALGLEGSDGTAALLRLRARILEAAGDWPQVLATLNRLLATPGVRARPADELRYARALYETDRAPLGRQILERLRDRADPPLAALVEYARREAEAHPAETRAALEAVLARAPRHESALQQLVARDLGAGDPAAALARLERADDDSGTLPPSLLLLRARVRGQAGDLAGAERDAQQAFDADPQLAPALELLVGLLASQGRAEEAVAALEERAAAGALPPPGQVALARLHLAAGRTERARTLYEQALAARGDLPVAKNDLAWLLAAAGVELERARQLAQEASAAEPDNADFADTLGFASLRLGQPEPALEQFRRALALDAAAQRERPLLHHHLGLALRGLGRDAEAAAAFARALALDADFAEAEAARRELEAARRAAATPPG